MTRVRHFVALLLLSASITAQQRDTRGSSPADAGEISGVIMSSDQNPQPVRRVVVTITAAELPAGPRSVITDDSGRFVFGRLPPGNYSVVGRKAAYLDAEFGSPKPGRPGTRLALAAGERRAIAITMFRGAALGGTLRDDAGAPLAGVAVTAIDARAVANNAANQAGGSAVTDDRGRYRIYSLPPGEYVISASASPAGSGEIAAAAASDIDAALSLLTQRQSGAIPAHTANAQLQALQAPRSVGYAPTYFPGTAFYPEANRIRVNAGENREGIDFPITHVPVASIEGVISGPVANLAGVLISITPDGPRTGSIPGATTITSKPPNAKGEFEYGNLTPGRYRIVARSRAGGEPASAQPGSVAIGGGRGGTPPPGQVLSPTGEMLYAMADVEVRGQDVAGVSLPLQAGGFISGKVVFDPDSKAPMPDEYSSIRVQISLQGGGWSSSNGTTRMGPAISAIPPVNLKDDGSFLIQGVGPGQYLLSCQLPGDSALFWKARTAVHEGRDLFDAFIDGPNVQLRDVVITLSDKRTELSGVLQSASGQPTTDFYVIAFSASRADWRFGARRNQSARPATDGRFVLTDLPAGEYFVAALTDLDPAEWQSPGFLEEIASAAIRITLAEGEKKRTDLRIK